MKRTPLSIGSTIQAKGGSSYTYIIDRVIGDGASSIVYEAHYVDHSNHKHHIRLKECYPYQSSIARNGNNLEWSNENERTNDIVAFKSGYDALMKDQKSNYIVHAFDQFESNNTMYIVMDANEGVTFDKTDFDSLKDILSTIKLLAHVVGEYHQKGYLHLDIKPSNFLVYPRPSEHIVLFDVDSVTLKDDIKNKKIKCVSYSKGWAAPEQMQGRIEKLCPATDVYSIGAILFQKIMGRAVENEDIGIFADWDFDGELFDDINPAIKRLLREIFKKTLAANIKRRYQSANELISALEEARKVAEQDIYLVNEDVFSEINFVGREKDLVNMHGLFNNGTKAIFLHGFGGVGKTVLARRFAELYAGEYDCVQFHRYTKDLSTIIDDYMINTNLDDQNSHRKQLKKICESTKALIIVDNFDVEDDEDLEYMLSLNVDLIFTTRNDYGHIACDKIGIVELEALPTKELVSIFRNEYGKSINDEEEELVEELIEKFGNLTILVPIIAKQIIASKISIEDFASSVENDAFARFDDENEDIRIRKDGKSQRTNSLDFIRAMFNIAGLSDKHKLVLRYLDLLKYHCRLTIKEYRRLTGENNLNVLNDLQFRNWISFVDAEESEETEIKVHQLIYDLVEKDDKPTYQNVPGIVSYIENCFDVLAKSIISDTNEDKESVDFEKASCITYALLIYDDIRMSESKDNRDQKTGAIFGFMGVAFLTDPEKTYKLFFESPKESSYYFYVNGIMDWFTTLNALIIETASVEDQLSKLEQPKLNFEFSDGTSISFENDKEKNEYRRYIEEQSKQLNSLFASNIIAECPYLVMSYYFYSKAGYPSTAGKNIQIIYKAETLLSENNGAIVHDNMSENDFLLYRLEWYLAICESLRKSNNVVMGVDISADYQFYVIVFNLLKKAIEINSSNQNTNFLEKAEELMILLERSNERFSSFGINASDIKSYVPETVQAHEENISRHWSKKADGWYESVDITLSKVTDPFEAYSWLLSYDYQNEFLNNSKITKLITRNIVDRIYNDSRLTAEKKTQLLVDHIVVQVKKLKVKRNIKKHPSLLKKVRPKAELYYQAISKIDQLVPNWKDEQVDRQVNIIDASLDLRKALDKEFFDINNHIHSMSLSVNNIDHVGEMLYLVDKLRVHGWIQKAKEIKSQILDLTLGCLTLSSDTLSGHTLQMILYKVRPLAIKYKREDVVSEIDKIEITLERKYSLNLIDPLYDIVSVKSEEQDVLARKFMDDYIDMVALEAYESLHGIVNTNKKIIDEMEHLLVQNLDELLRATDEQNSWYRNIFEDPCIRSLNPFWVSEFHGSSNPKINTGVCYLIAQTYETIPFKTGFGVALEDLIDEDGEYDYRLSKDEIQIVLNNIVTICPKAKKEIDAYLKKYPLK